MRRQRSHLFLNTISSSIASLMAIAALVVSVLVYMEQQNDSESAAKIDATGFEMFTYSDPQGNWIAISVANRGLATVYDAFASRRDVESEKDLQTLIFGDVSACTESKYTIPPERFDDFAEGYWRLAFKDASDRVWERKFRDSFTMQRVPDDPTVIISDDARKMNIVSQWGLKLETAELENCG